MTEARVVKLCGACNHESAVTAQRCENCNSIVLSEMTIESESKNENLANSMFLNFVPIILILGLLFFVVKMYLNRSGYPATHRIESKEELMDIVNDENEVSAVFFYHKSYDRTPKTIFPSLDKLNATLGHKLSFYKYRYGRQDFKLLEKYGKYEGVLVLFNNGEQLKSMPVNVLFKRKSKASDGLIFMFIKDFISLKSVNRFEDPQLQFLNEESFYEKVIEATNPVVVNFTRETCPAAKKYKDTFKSLFKKYNEYADFYYVDIEKEKEVAALFAAFATPTVIVFNKGEAVNRYSGAFTDMFANECRLFGNLYPALVDTVLADY